MSDQSALIPVLNEDQVIKIKSFLEKANEIAVGELLSITSIETDAQYTEAEATLAEARSLYEKMVIKRKTITDPIKKAIESIMLYENAINPDAKTENEYLRARKVLEGYNQSKIVARQKQEAIAKHQADLIKYRAEFKARIQTNLASKISGLHKTSIQRFGTWETSLTLENIDALVEQLSKAQPVLKPESYEECFVVWNKEPQLMSEEDEKNYLVDLRAELPYKQYNEQFQSLVAPIKNAYLARVPEIKKNLIALKEASETNKAALLKKQEEDRKTSEAKAIEDANKQRDEQLQSIADTKALGEMEGDFTQQAMTQEVEAGPSKMVYTFDGMWLPTFLQVVSKCAAHPKFKLLKGDAYVPEVQKFLDFYAANINEPMKGLKGEEKAKTIVRKAK